MNIITNLVVFAAVLGFLVFIHEWGHYYFYKLAGVKIREFSIGIGPGITFTRKNGEKWKLSPFLIGGYVMPENVAARIKDNPDAPTEPQPGDVEYARPWQRFVAAFAGPGVNIVAAIVLVSAALMLPRPIYKADIGEVVANSPAAVAGLQVGDRVLSVNNTGVDTIGEAFRALQETNTVTLLVERNGQPVQVTMTRENGAYGVAFEQKPDGSGPGLGITEAVPESIKMSYTTVINTFAGIGKLVTGNVPSEQVSGPVKFGEAVSNVGAQAGVAGMLLFLGMLSLVLGVANLIPVPPLDGGHLVKEGLAMVGINVPKGLWNAIGMLIGVVMFGATLLWLGWDIIGPYWQYTWVKVASLVIVLVLVYKMLFVVKE